MAKRLNQFVMKAEFRDGLREVYFDALVSIGVTVKAETIRPHIIGTATINVTESDLSIIRAHYGDSMTEVTLHRNSGDIEVMFPEGEQYLANHRPTLTKEEREAKASKGTGINREESAKRRQVKEALRQRLIKLHGIDLTGDNPDFDDDSDD